MLRETDQGIFIKSLTNLSLGLGREGGVWGEEEVWEEGGDLTVTISLI